MSNTRRRRTRFASVDASVSATYAVESPNKNVAEGWLKTKLGDHDDVIRERIAERMAERSIGLQEATDEVNEDLHLNGFHRDAETGELYIEGRQLKAALKESSSIAVAAGKLPSRGWGKTNKGIKSFLAEHVFVAEDRLGLGVTEPSGINQRFISTFRGTGIQYEEFVEGAEFGFTVLTDQELTEKDWAMIWLTGQQQGVGAARSQGYGRYEVLAWEPLDPNEPIDLSGLDIANEDTDND